ncbi:uncharacterized protein Bfra_000605 [Botrytis fragariae]|uniref:Uncharacterized protein n=1 Tax=Botrytis fragariae TaxID=1964551 RepID=A0A8H6B320_9HELO|nr:uncharacterized protein Bfra_000605 [Botrytis fragariae]KAF5878439.1 hypothetical protein Bfra_000605 [Botrytis fragariae]
MCYVNEDNIPTLSASVSTVAVTLGAKTPLPLCIFLTIRDPEFDCYTGSNVPYGYQVQIKSLTCDEDTNNVVLYVTIREVSPFSSQHTRVVESMLLSFRASIPLTWRVESLLVHIQHQPPFGLGKQGRLFHFPQYAPPTNCFKAQAHNDLRRKLTILQLRLKEWATALQQG